MPRDVRAYLSDIIDACKAISIAMEGLKLDSYRANRLIRSSVEREFTIIGEAIAALSRVDPQLFDRISQARHIVDFRNQLTHGYATVNDAIVWGIAVRDVPQLRRECEALLAELGPEDQAD